MTTWKDLGWRLVARESRWYQYETPKGTRVTVEDTGGYGWTWWASFAESGHDHSNDGWSRKRDAMEDVMMYVEDVELELYG